MVNIVVINGVGGVGKSEFCKQSQEYSKKRWKNVVVYEVSTVDFVKLVAVYAGWNGEKDEKGRKLLYDIKEALTKYGDIPNKKVIEHVEKLEQMNGSATHIVFVNCRQSYDITSFKNLVAETHPDWNVITLLIKNSNKSTNEVPELIEEVNKTKYDCTIDNTGDIELLHRLAGNFLEDIVDGKYNKKQPDYEKLYKELMKQYKEALEKIGNSDYKPLKDNVFNFHDFDNYPSVCEGCTNNPKNGGSGICLCTLPYMTTTTGKPLEITYSTVTDINSFKDDVRNTNSATPNIEVKIDSNLNQGEQFVNTTANTIFNAITTAMNKRNETANKRNEK